MTVFTHQSINQSINQHLEHVTGSASMTELQQYCKSAFQDVGLLTEDNTSRSFNASKLRRQRAKLRFDNRQVETDNEAATLHGLYFDGHKDKTIVQ
jgi:hypothetical protein